MPTINGHPVSYIPIGDVEACAVWLPYAKNLLAGLFAVARGSPLSKALTPDNNTRIELYALGDQGRIIITVQDPFGVVFTPRTDQHPMGWGTPLKDDDGNPINDPLGTPLVGDDIHILSPIFPGDVKPLRVEMETGNNKYSNLLTPDEIKKKGNTVVLRKKTKQQDSPYSVKSRGKNLYFGNIVNKLKIGKNWHVISFNGPTSGWRHHPRERIINQHKNIQQYGIAEQDFFYQGKRIASDRVLYAGICQKKLSDGTKEYRVYQLVGSGSGCYLKWAKLGSVFGKTPWPWTTVWGGDLLNKDYLTTEEFVEGGMTRLWPTANYAGRWVIYSVPKMNENGTELSFIIAAQGVWDSSIVAKILRPGGGDNGEPFCSDPRGMFELPVQKYLAVFSIGASTVVYHIERYDADDGTTADYVEPGYSYIGPDILNPKLGRYDRSFSSKDVRIKGNDIEQTYYLNNIRKKVVKQVESNLYADYHAGTVDGISPSFFDIVPIRFPQTTIVDNLRLSIKTKLVAGDTEIELSDISYNNRDFIDNNLRIHYMDTAGVWYSETPQEARVGYRELKNE